jgi:hypothetical protein
MRSFGFAYKQPGLNIGPDPRGTNYAYYGITTTTTNTGNPALSLNYGGPDLKSFTVTDLVMGCGYIVPITGLILECQMRMTAYDIGNHAVGNETYTIRTSMGTQQLFFDKPVTLSRFESKSWTSVTFNTTYSVKNLLTGEFIPIPNVIEANKLKPYTYLDDIQMIITPKECANCPV